ncbi:hypothetical protein HZS38_11990 [Xenorhabdus nematophila]|uniref:hypothetical protein n=1 Tax=Xenorhabdus nematophila TaxID=628 RepID=UPI00056ED5C2|nr:hypothetical protein [Xenorhabdus nematophila]AYA41084.1 hypothetical protein D3790_12040 [Xenorhabdus nematophila]KHD27289.1 hypothetical protein LH67_19500 [Xenorhabdus nematophila]MBA0019833.1 hypothetical protein [Xenorhabdus nematophila]MCB4426637.1 hypothetical protein [Xenorhabdus nematophila]QNJ35485.1 hypothetical protein H8F46_11830 [Xenorhabdus nematophila]
MFSKYVLITRFPLKEKVNMKKLNSLEMNSNNRYFISEEKDMNELLELRSFSSISEIEEIENEIELDFIKFSSILRGDIRRELVKFVEAPIDSENELPMTKYIQLRHVEVPPENYNRYRQWRDETIFNVVRENKDKITSFGAYHSFISGQPGVMFISSFNVNKEKYLESFTNEHYQNIIKQAGDNYITGGNDGLYTRIYRSIQDH